MSEPTRQALERAYASAGMVMGARDWRAELNVETMHTLLAASEALLALRPASDEEIIVDMPLVAGCHPRSWEAGYRAAERRLIPWKEE